MKKSSIFFLMLSISIMSMCTKKIDTETDMKAIKKIGDQMAKALNDNDIDLLMELYSDDAILMPQDQPTIEGKEAIRLRNQYILEIAYNVTYPTDEVKISEDWAMRRGTLMGSWKPKEGELGTVNNKAMQILHRQTDGSWKITHNIFNSN